jgi:hypothetical protein
MRDGLGDVRKPLPAALVRRRNRRLLIVRDRGGQENNDQAAKPFTGLRGRLCRPICQRETQSRGEQFAWWLTRQEIGQKLRKRYQAPKDLPGRRLSRSEMAGAA